MKFPSIQSLYSSIRYVVKRFPFEISFALLGVIAASINIELKTLNVEASNWCTRLTMIANLGVVLSLSATIFAEIRHFKYRRKY